MLFKFNDERKTVINTNNILYARKAITNENVYMIEICSANGTTIQVEFNSDNIRNNELERLAHEG